MGKSKAQVGVQNFGRFLSGMVMPNIGAFIAWGLITALFIDTGWLPNASFAELVGPMLSYLLPILIAYTGGKMVGGVRGGVLGGIAVMGVIVGSDIPMLLGAMIMGPLGGFIIKKFDNLIENKIPSGFEMLVNNFSAGIIGTLLALFGYGVIGPVITGVTNVLISGAQVLVDANLLPIVSIVVEPAKVLFLNNAINHGVFTVIGATEAEQLGKSIFYLIETNPGPGLGILLAYWVYAKGMVKQSAPSAIIIHFFGGIHEIYFPYILMQPILVLAVMAGGVSGVFTFSLLGAGLTGVASPGSIFALITMAPKGGLLPVLAGVVVSTVVSFLVASIFIKKKDYNDEGFEAAKEQMVDLKGKQSSVVKTGVKKIIVACDAGMGSSAMGASKLRKKIKNAGLNIEVTNKSIDMLPADADIVITHNKLTDRAKSVAPNAQHIAINDFVNTTAYDELVAELSKNKKKIVSQADDTLEEVTLVSRTVLLKDNIKIGLKSVSKTEAIKMAGQLLVDSGYVDKDYIEAMLQREEDLTTYIGNGTAIPHGVSSAKDKIKKTGISVLQFPNGIEFGDEKAYIIVGIAGVGNEHLQILSNLAELLEDESKVEELRLSKDIDFVYKQFTNQ
jgi:PTS system mannitol-specific IIC component